MSDTVHHVLSGTSRSKALPHLGWADLECVMSLAVYACIETVADCFLLDAAGAASFEESWS